MAEQSSTGDPNGQQNLPDQKHIIHQPYVPTQRIISNFKIGGDLDLGQALRMNHAEVQKGILTSYRPDLKHAGENPLESEVSAILNSVSSQQKHPQLLVKTVSSDGHFSSNDENDEDEMAEQSYYKEPRKSICEQSDVYKATDKEEPAPLVNSGYDLKVDMKLGWRPEKDRISGAPIPLHYVFNDQEHSYYDLVTNLQIPALYYGPRIPNSLTMHKWYANKEFATSCEQISSYKFDVPILTNIKLPKPDTPRQFLGMNPGIPNYDLKFDSNFESGNLDMVIKTKESEYDLFMRVDTNTRGHHQWFYFSVEYRGPQMCNKSIKFNLCNFTKPTSLYSNGMKICVARQSQDYQWHKSGENITYGKSHHVRRSVTDPNYVRYYYKMSFTYNFGKQKGDQIYFAYSFPYTFSKQVNFIRQLHEKLKSPTMLLQQRSPPETTEEVEGNGKQEQKKLKENDFLLETTLCKTLSGVNVPLLTITSRVGSDPDYNKIKLEEFEDKESRISLPLNKKKKYIIISGRVHPGETPASWMMQGFLNYLTSDCYQAKQLRKRVIFKVIPMLNPDGVIVGNYRTSMAGCDLNRRYDNPDYRLHPTVWSTKKLTSYLLRGDPANNIAPPIHEDDLVAFVDLHGHSRKKSVFMFGPQVPLHSGKYLKMRVLPKLLSEETEMFRYHSCRFQNEKSKERAARIVMHKEFNICNCFTLEASFYGHFGKDNVNHEFTSQKYEEMGAALVNSLYEYVMIVEENERRKQFNKVERLKSMQKKNNEGLPNSPHQEYTDNQAISNGESMKKKAQKDKSKQSAVAYNKTSETKRKTILNAGKKASSAKVNVQEKKTKKKSVKQLPVQQQEAGDKSVESVQQVQNQNFDEQEQDQDEDDRESSCSEKSNQSVANDNNSTISENSYSNPNEPITNDHIVEEAQEETEVEQTYIGYKKKRTFRNLDEVLDEVQKIQDFAQDETSSDEDQQENEDQVEQLDQDQGGSDDDLNAEQVKELNQQILNTIFTFRKALKISEEEYFGRPLEVQKKRISDIKPKVVITNQNSGVNYQSNTVSIAQKRRSYLEELKQQQKQEEILTGQKYNGPNNVRKKKSTIINSNFVQGQYQAVITRNIKPANLPINYPTQIRESMSNSMLSQQVFEQVNYSNILPITDLALNNFKNVLENTGITGIKRNDAVQKEYYLQQQQPSFAQSVNFQSQNGLTQPEKLIIKGLVGLSSKPKVQNDIQALQIKGITRSEQPQQTYQSPQSQNMSGRQNQLFQQVQKFLTPSLRKESNFELLKEAAYSVFTGDDLMLNSPRESLQRQVEGNLFKIANQAENIVVSTHKTRKPFTIKNNVKKGSASAPPVKVNQTVISESPVRQSTATPIAQKIMSVSIPRATPPQNTNKKVTVTKQRTEHDLAQSFGGNQPSNNQVNMLSVQMLELQRNGVQYSTKFEESEIKSEFHQTQSDPVYQQNSHSWNHGYLQNTILKPNLSLSYHMPTPFQQRMNTIYQKQQLNNEIKIMQSKHGKKQSRQIPVKSSQDMEYGNLAQNYQPKSRVKSNDYVSDTNSQQLKNQIKDLNLTRGNRQLEPSKLQYLDGLDTDLIQAEEFTVNLQYPGPDQRKEDNNHFFHDRKVNSNQKTKPQSHIKILPQHIKKNF